MQYHERLKEKSIHHHYISAGGYTAYIII